MQKTWMVIGGVETERVVCIPAPTTSYQSLLILRSNILGILKTPSVDYLDCLRSANSICDHSLLIPPDIYARPLGSIFGFCCSLAPSHREYSLC